MIVLGLLGLFAAAWWVISPQAATLAASGLVALGLVITCVLVWPAQLVARDTNTAGLDPQQRASAINGVRTTLVQGIVGLVAVASIFVAWKQFQTDRAQLTEQLNLTRQGQIADRFTRAVDQLGSDRLEQRVGGIYGLERIAKESPDDSTRLVITEVLATYVRKHAPPAAKPPIPDPLVPLMTRVPDVQAAVTVLGRRTVAPNDPTLILGQVDLRMADLRDADLQGAHLGRTQLVAAALVGAKLQRARLGRAQLQHAFLMDAQLQGADLAGANFDGAILAGANLQGARLNGANLQNTALHRAIFTGATANKDTVWPQGFDWRIAGVILQEH